MIKKLKTIISIILSIIILGICIIFFKEPSTDISGIENYNKNYYIDKYRTDLDSSLEIFPNTTNNMIDATFISSFKTNLFDSAGYIILKTKYNSDIFKEEIDRLKSLKLIISNCQNKSYTNYVKYDNKSYEYPAFITIDGFASTYEYALINEENLEIIYIYLAYPNIDNLKYKKYLKKDKNYYLKKNTLDMYSMYNHTFNGGDTYIEYNDC